MASLADDIRRALESRKDEKKEFKLVGKIVFYPDGQVTLHLDGGFNAWRFKSGAHMTAYVDSASKAIFTDHILSGE